MREKWYGRERQPAFPPAIAPDGGWPQSTEQPNADLTRGGDNPKM
jgi:hypothetical protein